MTPRTMASDLKIPQHNLAHFYCAKSLLHHSKILPFLIPPSIPNGIGRQQQLQDGEKWQVMVAKVYKLTVVAKMQNMALKWRIL